jgi:BlaI family transcriptional regulator, penicillinase repressor
VPSPRPPLPTEAELQVLRILWLNGPSTVREVHDSLYAGTDIGYTTSLKLLQNMHAKRLVTRDAARRQHVYAAAAGEADTLHRVARQMIDRSFQGSAAALAMHALGAKRATAEELANLKALIRKLEREGGA